MNQYKGLASGILSPLSYWSLFRLLVLGVAKEGFEHDNRLYSGDCAVCVFRIGKGE